MSYAGAHINVRGVVQGVGFRYWCLHKAREYGVNGWVANIPDGTVELEVAADRSLIEEFVKVLKVGPSQAHVSDIDIRWLDPPGQYDGFTIKHKGW